MNEARVRIAEEFARAARREFGDRVRETILFGSVARGDDHADSDIDVLVIWDGAHEEGLRLLTGFAFHRLLVAGDPETYVSVKLLSPDEFDEGRRSHNAFVEAIVDEGRALA